MEFCKIPNFCFKSLFSRHNFWLAAFRFPFSHCNCDSWFFNCPNADWHCDRQLLRLSFWHFICLFASCNFPFSHFNCSIAPLSAWFSHRIFSLLALHAWLSSQNRLNEFWREPNCLMNDEHSGDVLHGCAHGSGQTLLKSGNPDMMIGYDIEMRNLSCGWWPNRGINTDK